MTPLKSTSTSISIALIRPYQGQIQLQQTVTKLRDYIRAAVAEKRMPSTSLYQQIEAFYKDGLHKPTAQELDLFLRGNLGKTKTAIIANRTQLKQASTADLAKAITAAANKDPNTFTSLVVTDAENENEITPLLKRALKERPNNIYVIFENSKKTSDSTSLKAINFNKQTQALEHALHVPNNLPDDELFKHLNTVFKIEPPANPGTTDVVVLAA